MLEFGTQNGQGAQAAQGQQNQNQGGFIFVGEESLDEFTKAHPNAGFVRFKRKEPKTFVNRKGVTKTLTDVIFIKEIFTDAQGNKTQGVTLGVVSSELDMTKPKKIAVVAMKREVVDPKTGETIADWVTQKILCNVGENASGEFVGMLSELQ